jgi:hypothetical protein
MDGGFGWRLLWYGSVRSPSSWRSQSRVGGGDVPMMIRITNLSFAPPSLSRLGVGRDVTLRYTTEAAGKRALSTYALCLDRVAVDDDSECGWGPM